jgi:hypothetical protein
MFIAALFTIADLWKWSRCPTMDDWMMKIANEGTKDNEMGNT